MRMSEKQLREAVAKLGPEAARAVAEAKRIVLPAPIAPGATQPPPRAFGASLPPGTVIATFEVKKSPRPWRAPLFKGNAAVSPARVKRFKEAIAWSAHEAGYGEQAGIPPYNAPVEVHLYLCRKAPAGVAPGTRWARRPDWDNLSKGICDSVSGNVFKKIVKGGGPGGEDLPARLAPPSPIGRILADDNIVTDAVVRKRYWTRGLVFVRVIAVAVADSGPYPFG